MRVSVILGHELKRGGLLDAESKSRLDCFLRKELVEPADFVILSGGRKPGKHRRSEAAVMAEYLLKKGVPKRKLILERHSLTTSENVRLTVPILKKLHPDQIRVISSRSHLTRFLLNPILMFKRSLRKYPEIELKFRGC